MCHSSPQLSWPVFILSADPFRTYAIPSPVRGSELRTQLGVMRAAGSITHDFWPLGVKYVGSMGFRPSATRGRSNLDTPCPTVRDSRRAGSYSCQCWRCESVGGRVAGSRASGLLEEAQQRSRRVLPQAAGENQSRFSRSRCADPGEVGVEYRRQEFLGSRFSEVDRQDRRAVDDRTPPLPYPRIVSRSLLVTRRPRSLRGTLGQISFSRKSSA